MHKEKHKILKSLKEHRYTSINHLSKIMYLSKGSNTTSLDSVKTLIMSDESLRHDFNGCVTLYNDFVKKLSTDCRQSLGTAASITNNASGNKSITFYPEDQYYDSNECYAIIKSYKDKVLKARSGRNVGKKSTK